MGHGQGSRWVVAAAMCSAAACAGAADDAQVSERPASAMLGAERLRLPGAESVGMVGASYVLELSPGWWIGPSLYGAATGRRGGLFAWGVEAQRRWRLGEHWGVVAGLFTGGGGGAAAPVGGGLMLRPHVDLMVDYGGWQLGLTASHVRFQTGTIRSSQLGVLLMVDDRYAFAPFGQAGQRVQYERRGGIGADSIHATTALYARQRRDGESRIGTVGARIEQQVTSELHATMEAAGAAAGGADGYMEVLAGLGLSTPVASPSLRLGARAAVGLAGGGAVDTGGGALVKAALTARWQATRKWSVDVETGHAWAPDGDFRSPFTQVSVGMALDDGGSGRTSTGQSRTLHDMAWEASVLHYAAAARKSGGERDMQLVGLHFNRFLAPQVYLTGQAHAAAGGGAGAYAVGLVGLGVQRPIGARWDVGAEALVGAAGGGGVAIQGGALAQPMAWVGRRFGPHSQLKLAAGYLKARKGELATPVMQLSWSVPFGAP